MSIAGRGLGTSRANGACSCFPGFLWYQGVGCGAQSSRADQNVLWAAAAGVDA
jgi:hypothetical protein